MEERRRRGSRSIISRLFCYAKVKRVRISGRVEVVNAKLELICWVIGQIVLQRKTCPQVMIKSAIGIRCKVSCHLLR